MECVDFMQPRWPSRISTFNSIFCRSFRFGTGESGGISFCLRHRLSWRVQASQHTAGHRRRKAITFLDLLRFLPFLIDNLCLNCACKSSSTLSALQAQKGKSMQNGSMMRTERHGGPDVWEFRWREPGPNGKSRHRRMVVGTTNEFGDEVAARQAIAGLHLRMNARNERVKVRPITLRISGSLSAARVEARYSLENPLDKGDIRRLFK